LVHFLHITPKTEALLLTQLPMLWQHLFMTSSDTIILVMADRTRRAACFNTLVGPPQRIVRGFSDADEAIAALECCDSGCVLIDSEGLPSGALSKLLHAVGQFPSLITLLLAETLDSHDALAMIRAAPCDLLPRNTGVPEMTSRALALLPLARLRGEQARALNAARVQLARLSPREVEVLRALYAGQTSKDIGRALGVSSRTIEVHRASIMRRTGATTLAELLRLCFLTDFMVLPAQARAA
jgi:two-component system response regulator FixJ